MGANNSELLLSWCVCACSQPWMCCWLAGAAAGVAASLSQPHTGFLLLFWSCGQACGEDMESRCADVFPGLTEIFCIYSTICIHCCSKKERDAKSWYFCPSTFQSKALLGAQSQSMACLVHGF